MTRPAAVIWHDVECGAYAADLELWRELAEAGGGAVLDVGAGTGRVALDLARRGHDVTALDLDPALLAELGTRAGDLPVATAEADARDFDLGRRFALIAVPMQTIQILGGSEGRAGFFAAARRHLEDDGRLVLTVTSEALAFEAHEQVILPTPDMAEHDGWVYASQPIGIRGEPGAAVIERLRVTVSPDGERTEEHDEVRLDTLDPAVLEDEAAEHDLVTVEHRTIPETDDHVGSAVIIFSPGRSVRNA